MSQRDEQYNACGATAIAIVILIAIACIFAGCSTTKKTTTTSPTIVEVKNDTQREVIHEERIDTIYIEIPAQSAERTTLDSLSHLETDYAESDARINPDGSLFHDLRNKETKHPAAVKNSADTIKVTQTIETPVPYPVKETVTVERDFTWWETVRLKTWWLLLIVAGAATGWIFRKPLKSIATTIANMARK